MTSPIRTERHGDILVIVSDSPPVNALGMNVRQGLDAAVKQGVADENLIDMLTHCAALEHVRVKGLMIMAPIGDASVARATFKRLRELRDAAQSDLAARGIDMELHELSMGMSNDYSEGIGEGATMVRIGRAIFSADYAG